MQAAIYARVSTIDQEPENQRVELRQYAAVRGWSCTEFVDRGVSGPLREIGRRKPRRRAVGDSVGGRCQKPYETVRSAAGPKQRESSMFIGWN